jgi:hypothetical protein
MHLKNSEDFLQTMIGNYYLEHQKLSNTTTTDTNIMEEVLGGVIKYYKISLTTIAPIKELQ